MEKNELPMMGMIQWTFERALQPNLLTQIYNISKEYRYSKEEPIDDNRLAYQNKQIGIANAPTQAGGSLFSGCNSPFSLN